MLLSAALSITRRRREAGDAINQNMATIAALSAVSMTFTASEIGEGIDNTQQLNNLKKLKTVVQIDGNVKNLVQLMRKAEPTV